jgi:hypothetical protein
MVVTGIDPGKDGQVVTLDSNSFVGYSQRLRYSKDGLLDAELLKSHLDTHKPNLVLLEKVGGRAGWGATQNFSFGCNWAQVRLTISSYPYRLIAPQTWQKLIHQGVATNISTKERSLVAYEQLYPNRPLPVGPKSKRPDDNLIDALLLATFGMMSYYKCCKQWDIHEEQK